MPAYNRQRPARNRGTSPVKTSSAPSGTTFEGAPGYSRDPKSELFLLGSTQFMRQDVFYERARERDNRFVNLVHLVAVQDPIWLLRFVRWLRNEGNIRSASLVAGLEGAKAVLDTAPSIRFLGEQEGLVLHGQGLARNLAKAGIRRADEIGEGMAYWTSKYGKNIPKPVKRAFADRVVELYNEYTLLKYDTASHGFRFGDVIQLVHPEPREQQQAELFKYAMDRRYGNEAMVPDSSLMLGWNSFLYHRAAQGDYSNLLDPNNLRRAGMTWEDALSLAGSKVDKKLLWEAMIPSMGYMALLRNLRNFDQAGVDDEVAGTVASRLANPVQVLNSRQLPFRFLSAYREVPSLRWGWALEQALNHSLMNIPELSGRTLILVDTSGSMAMGMSDHSKQSRWDVAAIFGLALAQRCEQVDVVSFASASVAWPRRVGSSLLVDLDRWKREGFNLNGGTDTFGALRRHFSGHNRVVIVTDEQANTGYFYGAERYYNQMDNVIPTSVPVHVINVAGYEKGMMPSGEANRHTYGGLNDAMFKLIPLVEAGAAGQWPWEQQ